MMVQSLSESTSPDVIRLSHLFNRTNSLVWTRSFSLNDADQKINPDLVIKKVAREHHTQVFGASIGALEGRDPNTIWAGSKFDL